MFIFMQSSIVAKQSYFNSDRLRLSFQSQLLLTSAHERHLHSEFDFTVFNFLT